METPDFILQPESKFDTCAETMGKILSELAIDLGDQVYPDAPLVHQTMDQKVKSTTADGPDGPTTMFWCGKYDGGCDYSFLLRQPKDGLPPLVTEEALAVRGTCRWSDNIRRAFQRVQDAIDAASSNTAHEAEPSDGDQENDDSR